MTTTELPTAVLGTTGMDLTRVGFGAWAIGGGDWAFGWGAQDDEQSVTAIRHAVESGLSWVDTAAAYGLGHSEEVVARALEPFSDADRPFVFTKCGLVWDESDRSRPPAQVGAPGSIRREAEASLRRLRVERIDLYQLHWPPQDGTAITDTWATLLDLRREGKIRAAGLSNVDVAQLEACAALGHVDSVQPPFSAVSRGTAADVIPWCAAQETGVIVYSPMQSGLLTGSFSAERAAALPDDDWRRTAPDFTGEALTRNLALADALTAVGQRHGVGTAAVAVAWTLAWEGVTGAIVGGRNPAQVDGWLPAATLHLADADLDEIARAIDETGAGHGPHTPLGRADTTGHS